MWLLAIPVLVLATGWGGWAWWKAGAYRRAAAHALAGPIASIEYQPSPQSPFVVLRDPADIAIVKEFLLGARATPDPGEAHRPRAVYEPDCAMRIRFADGHVEELVLGITLPHTGGYGQPVVIRANAVIAWQGYRRYGASDILGMLYADKMKAGTLAFRQAPKAPTPALVSPRDAGLGPLDPRDRLGASGHDGRTLGIVGAARGAVDYGRFVRKRLFRGSAQFASEGHRYLHVGFPRRRDSESGSVAAYARVVDAETGEMLGQVEVVFPPRTLVGAALAPDGHRLVVATYDIPANRTEVTVVDVASGETRCAIPDYDGNNTYPLFSPDGSQFALGWYPGSARAVRFGLYDATSGRPVWVRTYPWGGNLVPSIAAFSRDGRRLLVHSETTVVYDTRTGEPLWERHDLDNWATALLSPDGQTVAAVSNTRGLLVLDTESGAERRRLPCDVERRVLALAISPDGATLAVSLADGTVRLLSSAMLVQRAGWSGDGEPPIRGTGALVFSPDGSHLLVRARDYSARLVDLASGREVLHVRPPRRDERPEEADTEGLNLGLHHLSRPFSGDGLFLLLGFPFDDLTKREPALMLLGQE